jgi:hypothetical protein
MPRLTADQWAAIRVAWEGEPTATFTALAEQFGINKAQISRVASRDGWAKRHQLESINEAAHRKADAKVNAEGNATQRELNVDDLATRSESEAVRAGVLVRHRTEWAALDLYRRYALEAMDEARAAGQREDWMIAKTAADTAKANLQALQIKQDGERKAWGLDDAAIKIDVTKASDAELEALVRGGR